MANWSISGLKPLILPVDLDGAFVHNKTSCSNHMHISVAENMRLTMSPQSYDFFIRTMTGERPVMVLRSSQVLLLIHALHGLAQPCKVTCRWQLLFSPNHDAPLPRAPAGNITESRSVFEPILSVPPPRVFNTQFSSSLMFGPCPSEKPSFLLTMEWEHLKGTLTNDPAWWDPSLLSPQNAGLRATGPTGHAAAAAAAAPADQSSPSRPMQAQPLGGSGNLKAREPQPALQLEFRGSSLVFQMMQGTGNMHVSFASKEARLYDVRRKRVAQVGVVRTDGPHGAH